jgi:5-oxopent-3-ene-1,2,5-tricarboxylate decarboxylase/2-hydroxyhepta-2,4-diene-1,7-dioate isomerase
MASTFDLTFEFAPYPPVGHVYGVLMNHRAALAALGEAAHQPPYKAPPKAPVLYVKPRNTLVAPGAPLRIDDPAGELEVGAALGIVIGRTACAVAESEALDFVAGYVIVADCSLPHDSYFRPAIRFKARDGSCAIGPKVVCRGRHRRCRCARRSRPGRRPAGARHQHRRHFPRRGPPGERRSASS